MSLIFDLKYRGNVLTNIATVKREIFYMTVLSQWHCGGPSRVSIDQDDMTPAYVALTSTGARFHLSSSTFDAITVQIIDAWGDLAEKPAWLSQEPDK
jgi:hypothetical protein